MKDYRGDAIRQHREGKGKKFTFEERSRGQKGKSRFKEEYFSIHVKPKMKRGTIRRQLILERGHQCQSCLNTEWLGQPIMLELEHINGDGRDNRRENLKLLCPNCHSQTPTWRRKKYARVVE